jgi:hypothetical protein
MTHYLPGEFVANTSTSGCADRDTLGTKHTGEWIRSFRSQNERRIQRLGRLRSTLGPVAGRHRREQLYRLRTRRPYSIVQDSVADRFRYGGRSTRRDNGQARFPFAATVCACRPRRGAEPTQRSPAYELRFRWPIFLLLPTNRLRNVPILLSVPTALEPLQGMRGLAGLDIVEQVRPR